MYCLKPGSAKTFLAPEGKAILAILKTTTSLSGSEAVIHNLNFGQQSYHLRYDHYSIAGFAVTGFIDCDDVVFQFLSLRLLYK